VRVDEGLQSRLVHGGEARVDSVNESKIQVGADDLETLAGEHRRQRSSEFAKPDDRNFHA
jgi:hypothetical protein